MEKHIVTIISKQMYNIELSQLKQQKEIAKNQQD